MLCYICPQKSLLQMKGDNQKQIQQRKKKVEEVKQAQEFLKVIMVIVNYFAFLFFPKQLWYDKTLWGKK